MDANEFGELSKAQATKFKSYYETEFSTLYPKPVMKIVGLDWKFYGLVATSFATVVVAALRTAQMFYFAEELSSKFWTGTEASVPILGWTGALFSMFAFEGGLALISAVKTAESKKISNDVYTAQIGLLLAISIVAGIGQSLGLVQGIDQKFVEYFSYLLVGLVGIGASVAAWLSGEILGVQLAKFSELREEAKTVYDEDIDGHLKNGRKKFLEKIEEEKSAKREQKSQNREEKLENNERSSHQFSENREEKRNELLRSSQKPPQNRNSPSEKARTIWREMGEVYENENKRILDFSELRAILWEKYGEDNWKTDSLISKQRNIWIDQQKEFENENGTEPLLDSM